MYDLQRNNQRLEAFKRTIMNSFTDADLVPTPMPNAQHDTFYTAAQTQPNVLIDELQDDYAPPPAMNDTVKDTFRFSTAHGKTVDFLTDVDVQPAAPAQFSPLMPGASEPPPPPPVKNNTSAYSTGSSGTTDARDYFKRLKRILPADDYAHLYTNVRLFNARQQSAAKTLQNVRQIIGARYPSFYAEFEQIMKS